MTNKEVIQKAEWILLSDRKPEFPGQYLCFGFYGGSQQIQQFTYSYDSGENFWHDGDLENLTGTMVEYWLNVTEKYSDPVTEKSTLTYDELMELIKAI